MKQHLTTHAPSSPRGLTPLWQVAAGFLSDRARFAPIVSAVACVLLAGCGGTPYEHATVTGNVTIDGQKVPKGAITFSPASKGPVTGAAISDGRYVCQLVPLGQHTVSFHAQAAEFKQMLDVSTGSMRQVPQDILPPQYRNGVPAEVQAGENQLDFALTTDQGPQK